MSVGRAALAVLITGSMLGLIGVVAVLVTIPVSTPGSTGVGLAVMGGGGMTLGMLVGALAVWRG